MVSETIFCLGRRHLFQHAFPIVGREQIIDNRADDAGVIASAIAFHQRVKAVLRKQCISHPRVVRQQTNAAKSPTRNLGPRLNKSSLLNGLVRAMKAAHTDMHDALTKLAAGRIVVESSGQASADWLCRVWLP